MVFRRQRDFEKDVVHAAFRLLLTFIAGDVLPRAGWWEDRNPRIQ
jgi:hypothetical protein